MAKQKISTSMRLLVIERDNYRCRACGIADVDSLQADHIIPASKGGKIDIQNLQTLCGVCNNRKGSTNVGELPIRSALPPGSGFGEYNEVMRERARFIETVSNARNDEISDIMAKVKQWREEKIESMVIKNRLEKMVGVQRVRSVMFHPDAGWKGVS
jgi:5-methylcytosine-specific restriction enzyme A